MKSRLAMTAMVVVGLLMSGTGAGLAVSGLSGTKNASIAQYLNGTTNALECDRNGDGVVDGNEDLNGDAPGCDIGDTLPTRTSGDSDSCDTNGDGIISPSEAAANGCGGVGGEQDEENGGDEPATSTDPSDDSDGNPTSREEAAQPSRQVEAGGNGGELPFTGLAAIPILAGGIALLAGGLVLRRRTAQ